jgi:hypothetical protein
MTGLVLTPEHEYLYNGEPFLGCTNTLAEVGLLDKSHYTEEGALRGTVVHDRIERLLLTGVGSSGQCVECEGTGVVTFERMGADNMDVTEETRECDECLGEGQAPPFPHQGYVDAAMRYLEDSKAEILNVEMSLCDILRRIAGTPDLVAEITLRGASAPQFAVIDWKTGQPEPWHRWQLAWYEHLARCNKLVEGICQRIVVHLSADGTFTTRTYTSRDDWKVADAARLVLQARQFAA